MLRAGADKVYLNTAAIARPELIREASRAFGSSTILVSIEAIKRPDGTYEAYTDYGRQKTGVDVFEWAARAVELGAGELMVISIDREGTGQGFDLELTRRISEAVPVPVIAGGGAGKMEHVRQVVEEGRADAVSLASLLHYDLVKKMTYSPEEYAEEGVIDFLQNGATFTRVEAAGLGELKGYLSAHRIECRR